MTFFKNLFGALMAIGTGAIIIVIAELLLN